MWTWQQTGQEWWGEDSVTGLRLLVESRAGQWDFNGRLYSTVLQARGIVEPYADGAIIRHNVQPK
jgi:hypothetical protein